MKHLFTAFCFLAFGLRPAIAFNYNDGTNTYICNGTQLDIQAAINDAAANHPASSYLTAATVQMTAAGPGTVTLGENNTPLSFGTCVILTGNGRDGANATTVLLPASWPGQGNTANTNAVIQIGNTGAWIENIDIPDAVSGVPPFSAGTPKGSRITGVGYNDNAEPAQAYFCFIAGGSTTPPQITIDNCNITGGTGSNELIFMRGASNAWQTADTFGSGSNVFVESNTFNGSGYVCDANANAAITLRFNTIKGPMKIDGHGRASNTPARGVRLMEVYGNVWTYSEPYWQALEIRGGTNRVFNNSSSSTDVSAPPWFTFTDYGCLQVGLPNFGNVLLTPSNYPIPDQIGEGEDVKGAQASGGSDPAYVWNNTLSANGSPWPWTDKTVPGNSPGGTYKVDGNAYSTGAGVTSKIGLSTQSATLQQGSYTDIHGTWTNAVAIAGDSKRYATAATTQSSQKELFITAPGLAKAVAAAAAPAVNFNAYTNWQQQTGTGGSNWNVGLGSSGSFHISSEIPSTAAAVILANRDFYPQTPAQLIGIYDGTQGVNKGTTATMNSEIPSKIGVGWWVTDQGSWNGSLPASTSGLLYIWNGSAWVLSYTPYQYPYYGPAFTTQPIAAIVTEGTVALSVEANNSTAYQWYLNGTTMVQGATSPTLLLTEASFVAGSYTCVASNLSGSATSNAATISLTSTSDIGRLTNLSYRAHVGTGGNILIAGFAVGGQGTSGSAPLLIRGSGPSLIPFGIADPLPDPQIQLFSGSDMLAVNDGWGGSARIANTAASVGAFAWSNPSSRDSAILDSLTPGPYTIQIVGQSGDTGIALAEVYDATPEESFTLASPRLTNISARVQVGSGGEPPVVGFVVGGTTSLTLLLRASGPALVPFGVTGTLPDPQLQLYRINSNGTSTLLGSDTGWGGSDQIATEAASVGAFSWGDSATADSAILITLPPGDYTAQVSGASGDTGVALIEAYEVR